MTSEQLIFNAGDVAGKAYDLCQRMWKRPALHCAEATELVALARNLACLAQEIENRARGFPEPPPRHD